MLALFPARAQPPVVLCILALIPLLMAACGPPDDASQSQALASTPATASGYASGQAAGASAAGATAAGATAAGASAAPAREGAARVAPAGALHVERTQSFYDVTGGSARALLGDLVEKGPRVGAQHHFGRTAWTARWDISYEQPGGAAAGGAAVGGAAARERSCRMRRADVYMNVTVTLPRWAPPPGASSALRRDWKSFTEALAFHEREHRESIISAGRHVVRVLKSLEAPACPALKKKANARARALLEKVRDYNHRYDERTDHGRTQGAHWPLR